MAREGKLTTKQRKLIQGVAEGKPQGKAAIDAGYSPKSADTIASLELKKTKVVVALTDLMDKMGLSDERLLEKHKELLDAQKTVSVVSGKNADAGTVDFVDVPDFPVQAKALEMAYKLKGKFTEKIEHSGDLTIEVVRFGKSKTTE